MPVALGPRRLGPRQPNVLERRKAAEIAHLLDEGRARIGILSERDLLIAGAALYAGEGTKADGIVAFANSDPAMVAFFLRLAPAVLRHRRAPAARLALSP